MSSDKDIKYRLDRLADNPDSNESKNIFSWFADNIETEQGQKVLKELWEDTPLNVKSQRSVRAFIKFKQRIGYRRGSGVKRFVKICAGAAAVLFLPLLLFAGYIFYNSSAELNYIETYADYGTTEIIRLEDGTVIHLNSGSHIIYPEKFSNKKRKVFLTGEAYIDVSTDKKRPFTVDLTSVSIDVLGTRFNVKSYPEDNNINVSLLEGKIALRKDNELLDTLSPGDLVSFERSTGLLSKSSFSTEDYIRWDEGGLIFRNESMKDIVSHLRRIFNVDIVLRDNELAGVTFYLAFMNDESLIEILDALNYNNQMRIVNNGNIIDIYKK